MTFLLADPQDITREGIKSLLARTYPSATVVEIGKEEEIIARLSAYPDAVLVMDYTLFNISEEKLLVLNLRFPAAQFVFFSEQLSKDFLRRMIFSSRAFHVILKDCELAEISEGLHRAATGRQFVCNKIETWLYTDEPSPATKTPLTATEKEILKALSMGRTTKEIAAERFLSVYTVMTHRKNIFRKLGVNNAQEAIRYALRAGIVNLMEYYI